jgi:hypothetical protein
MTGPPGRSLQCLLGLLWGLGIKKINGRLPKATLPSWSPFRQIRGAVAEDERTLITDRRRCGRQAKWRSGQLLPWSVPPYGYIMDPKQPRACGSTRSTPP